MANVQTDAADFTSTGQATYALTDSTYYEFGAVIEATGTVQFFIDHIPVTARLGMNVVFNDAMTPTFAMIANGSAIDFDIDYVWVAQTR